MATTLSQVKTRVRERVDKTSSTYLSDSELTSYINASYAELYDLMVGTYQDYYTASTTFSLATSDAGVYAIASNIYKIRGVDYLIGSEYVPIKPFNWVSRGSDAKVLSYRLVGSSLRLEPTSDSVGSYRLWYIPAYTALSSDSDNLDSYMTRSNWEEYVVIDVSIKILAKEESNTDHLLFEKRQIRDRIETMANDRDLDQPFSVSDTRSFD